MNTNSLTVFAAPNKQSKIIAKLKTNDWMDVKEETPLWMKVLAQQIIGTSTKNVNGWILKEDLLSKDWIKLSAETPLNRFEISDSTSCVAIKVIDKKTNKPFQIIFTDNPSEPIDSLFQTGDYNADGAPDFLETYKDGDKTYYDEYIFDKEKGIFVFDEKLSG
ncbi:hypothetical protein ABIB40_001688 [Pedobacter sp. UYP30]|uniref:hypothetical protein n=1 Tax=Pedobacter sp. UYP30 TaxID=1756400 RepID=UPI003394B487